MADYAVLIRSLKHNLSSEASPVVVFGGSYGGSKCVCVCFSGYCFFVFWGACELIFGFIALPVLAAWFRLKYPHIAIGALASSAPILQFDDITPWSSFYDAVSQDFKV